ncbi:hypothetical protein TIFTF001_037575 [Ficus carica]|uniref:CCR4-Not complex component Not N-terminal domain-containing protein n=1 Tax=Ficus carica TaxID=3494 RepID=A0AA88E5K1_FICCA|nr:hypothetical protein TIFTF001_037575 [Ficus carica]
MNLVIFHLSFVGELESQIDNFEAELEVLSVKNGKTRPPRLEHLETSITRHKAHIMQLELILRLLDNDELSTDQVNDVKDFLDDYVELTCKREALWSKWDTSGVFVKSTPMLKSVKGTDGQAFSMGSGPRVTLMGRVPSGPGRSLVLAQAVSTVLVQSGGGGWRRSRGKGRYSDRYQMSCVKWCRVVGVARLATGAPILGLKSSFIASTTQVPDGIPETVVRTPPSKSSIMGALTATSPAVTESTGANSSSSPVILSNSMKEEELGSFPGRRSSSSFADAGLVRGIGRGGASSQLSSIVPLSSGNVVPGRSALGAAVSSGSDMAKRNILGADEKLGSRGMVQLLVSPQKLQASKVIGWSCLKLLRVTMEMAHLILIMLVRLLL